MSKFLSIDSPLMNGLNKLADIMITNLLTLVFFIPAGIIALGCLAAGDFFWLILCIPLSFPCGAAITAEHFVLLKIVRNEETYIVKTFFRSFKQNFKQATAIWYIKVFITVVLVADFWVVRSTEVSLPEWVPLGLLAVSVVMFLLAFNAFPLLAKFDNTVAKTVKNSVMVGLLIFPRTILMVLVTIAPFVLIFFVSAFVPVFFLLGISGPAFVCALIYNKTYKRFEPEDESKDADDWFIEPEESTDAEVIEESNVTDSTEG